MRVGTCLASMAERTPCQKGPESSKCSAVTSKGDRPSVLVLSAYRRNGRPELPSDTISLHVCALPRRSSLHRPGLGLSNARLELAVLLRRERM